MALGVGGFGFGLALGFGGGLALGVGDLAPGFATVIAAVLTFVVLVLVIALGLVLVPLNQIPKRFGASHYGFTDRGLRSAL